MRGMRRGGEGLSNRLEKDNPAARTAIWQNKSRGVEACLLLAFFEGLSEHVRYSLGSSLLPLESLRYKV